jgi:hypothetical protein
VISVRLSIHKGKIDENPLSYLQRDEQSQVTPVAIHNHGASTLECDCSWFPQSHRRKILQEFKKLFKKDHRCMNDSLLTKCMDATESMSNVEKTISLPMRLN